MSKPNNNGKETKINGSRPNHRSHRKGNGRGRSNSKPITKDECESKKVGDINNPAYYYEDATVLDQVMNFSFNQFGGVPVDLARNIGNTSHWSTKNNMIMAISLNPSVPTVRQEAVAAGRVSGIQTAALRNYLALSGSNAKTTNYAPQDVIILEMAMTQLIEVSTFLARALGISYLFNYRNRTYPEVLLKSMGIDPSDFRANLATYRVRYNTLLTLASKIPFPAAIPAFAKAAELYGSLYLDDDNSALAQTYLFVPNSVWLFEEEYDEHGAGLKTTSFCKPNTNPVTFGSYLNIFENMITKLLTSTSLNFIYSDIMRLVQNGKITQLIQFTPINEAFMVVPVYNEEVKTWMHNASIIGSPLKTAEQYISSTEIEHTNENDVSCNAATNSIRYNPQFKQYVEAGYEMVIDFDHDNVSVEEKVRATRLSARWMSVQNPSTHEWFTTASVTVMDQYITGLHFFADMSSPISVNSSFVSANGNPVSALCLIADIITKFDWAPILYFTNGTNDSTLNLVGDLDYYTVLDYQTLRRMYDYEIMHFYQM